jgi:hypothetical protein
MMESTSSYRLKVLNFVDLRALPELEGFLKASGFRLLYLDGTHVTDRDSFLEQAAKSLPQPDDLVAVHSWDAFEDSLANGLAAATDDRAAIIWTHAEKMLEGGLSDLVIITNILMDVARSFSIPRPGLPHPSPLAFCTVLAGVGLNFRELTIDRRSILP